LLYTQTFHQMTDKRHKNARGQIYQISSDSSNIARGFSVTAESFLLMLTSITINHSFVCSQQILELHVVTILETEHSLADFSEQLTSPAGLGCAVELLIYQRL